MKSTFKLYALAFLSIALFSCENDDDAPAPVTATNNFKLGTNTYPMSQGFRSRSAMGIPDFFATNVVLAGDGLVLDGNDILTGNGNLIDLEFYTVDGGGLQAGTYSLDNLSNDPQTVYVYTGVGYDSSTGDAAMPDEIVQGEITVEVLTNGNYKITGTGTAINANVSFTLNYVGALQLVN